MDSERRIRGRSDQRAHNRRDARHNDFPVGKARRCVLRPGVFQRENAKRERSFAFDFAGCLHGDDARDLIEECRGAGRHDHAVTGDFYLVNIVKQFQLAQIPTHRARHASARHKGARANFIGAVYVNNGPVIKAHQVKRRRNLFENLLRRPFERPVDRAADIVADHDRQARLTEEILQKIVSWLLARDEHDFLCGERRRRCVCGGRR